MPKLTETLWVGGANYAVPVGVKSALNVAQDLRGAVGWPEVEYMQVGLVDGPGNTVAAYHAAILALVSLQKTAGSTMVFCHGGSRSMAVCLMYLNLVCKREWDEWLELLRERVDADLPTIHEAHKEAFYKRLSWKMLTEAAR